MESKCSVHWKVATCLKMFSHSESDRFQMNLVGKRQCSLEFAIDQFKALTVRNFVPVHISGENLDCSFAQQLKGLVRRYSGIAICSDHSTCSNGMEVRNSSSRSQIFNCTHNVVVYGVDERLKPVKQGMRQPLADFRFIAVKRSFCRHCDLLHREEWLKAMKRHFVQPVGSELKSLDSARWIRRRAAELAP